MLQDEGKLSVDDPVEKYLPEFKGLKAADGTPARVTIRHLLTHTSGLGDYPEKFSFQRDYTEDDLWSMIRQQPLASPPGAQWKYSNLGYITLGILIRKMTGTFYGDVLQERIFRPLGMTRTRIISERAIIPDRAAGYVLRDKVLQNQSWVAPSLNTTADGALYVTVTDLAKWDQALEAGKFASPAMYREMWTRVRLNDGKTADYGFGWRLPPSPPGHRLIEHSGAWQGFSTHIARYTDDHLTVIALANRAGADTAHIAHTIAAMIRPAAPTKPQ
jgi:CubicO group peptidase (beta-lactamase class C family)